ncbi:MAG: cytochrome c oxidase subunit 3, partial [Pseudomonadales bacterium]
LFVGSVGLQWAWRAASREQLRGVKQGLVVGGVCAIAFVIGQLIAWRQLNAAGYFITSNPANAFFYLLTSLHAVHLFGGLVAWFKTITRAWAGSEISSVRLGVELCAVYWHFLLVVWLILFGLLLST